MIAAPPSDDGAVHDTVACPSPGTALTAVGAPGAVAAAIGVTGDEAADAGPLPTLLVAVTVKVYGLLFVSPVTRAVVVAPTLVVAPPGKVVTV